MRWSGERQGPWEAVIGLFSLIGGFLGGKQQAKASKEAARIQAAATEKGIAESARQYDQTREDYQPFRDLGYSGIEGFSDLVGLGGAQAQQGAINRLRESPLYQSLYGNGRDSILAAASATGGLRGGNTNASLYRLGEDTLSNVIQQQLANYAGTIGIGSGATDAVAGFGARAVENQNVMRQQGAAAQAQSALVRGGIAAQNWNNIGGFADDAIGSIFGKVF